MAGSKRKRAFVLVNFQKRRGGRPGRCVPRQLRRVRQNGSALSFWLADANHFGSALSFWLVLTNQNGSALSFCRLPETRGPLALPRCRALQMLWRGPPVVVQFPASASAMSVIAARGLLAARHTPCATCLDVYTNPIGIIVGGPARVIPQIRRKMPRRKLNRSNTIGDHGVDRQARIPAPLAAWAARSVPTRTATPLRRRLPPFDDATANHGWAGKRCSPIVQLGVRWTALG